MFNDLQDTLLERRETKNELRYLSCLDIKSLVERISNVSIKIKNIEKGNRKSINKFSTNEVDEYNIIKEVTYKNDKERIGLMSQLKPKYEKFVVDEVNKKITFFNKGFTKNKKKAI